MRTRTLDATRGFGNVVGLLLRNMPLINLNFVAIGILVILLVLKRRFVPLIRGRSLGAKQQLSYAYKGPLFF